MSYSDYEEEGEVEAEDDTPEDKAVKEMVIYCKYG